MNNLFKQTVSCGYFPGDNIANNNSNEILMKFCIKRKGKAVSEDRTANGNHNLNAFLKVLLNGSQCQLHIQADFTSLHCTGGWVGPRADLDTVAKREISFSIAQ
jgi:hypothetical protein